MFSWLNFLSYAVVTAATPGPNNIMSMSNASRLGFRRSFPFNLGIWLGFSAVGSLYSIPADCKSAGTLVLLVIIDCNALAIATGHLERS